MLLIAYYQLYIFPYTQYNYNILIIDIYQYIYISVMAQEPVTVASIYEINTGENNNNNKTLMNPDFQNLYYKYFKKYI